MRRPRYLFVETHTHARKIKKGRKKMSFCLRARRNAFRRWKISTLCSILLLLSLVLSVAACGPAPSSVASSRHSTILWDTWGVPHIFAENDEDLFNAFGYAQMQNHADLLLTLYGEGRGRAAEYWGAQYLSSDELVRTMNFPARAQQWLDAQTPEFRRYIQAFTDGMNSYANEHPAEIAPQFKVVLPIKPTDVFAHLERVFAEFLLGDCSNVISFGSSNGSGSNGWAIGPRDSASGEAMLLANH